MTKSEGNYQSNYSDCIREINDSARTIADLLNSGREDFIPFIVAHAQRIVDLYKPFRIDPNRNPFPSMPIKEFKYEGLLAYIEGRRQGEICFEDSSVPEVQLIRDWCEFVATEEEAKAIAEKQPEDSRKELKRLRARQRK